MRQIKGTVKNGVICPQKSVIILFEEKEPDEKLSDFLLLPELAENDPFFERDKDTGRELIF
ncbi:hypothetical protein [Gloeocapsa sp. PCC 73106]|uniref:hypothetical protein n=1 Tax=Gloeocapsa sp. PCC 73106 TaxID=102232 RepID=UPI0002AC8BB4|nr:hypothetical protein [Gloeocapsa sp. PCC 73106]ELR98561.1 hypothetical protein GLO73106DRAFT_00023950 [Gloeocapsa sp. PCC 73106]